MISTHHAQSLARYFGISFLLALVMAMSADARAHSATYYSKTWTTDINLAFGYQTGSLSTATARSSYNAADAVWNSVTDISVDFYNSGSVNSMVVDSGNVCDVPASRVWIVSNDLSSGTLARSSTCGSPPNRGIVVVDSPRTWEYGSAVPTSSEWDLRGTMTHEYGHITGFSGHFPSADCAANALQTMCPTYSVGNYQWRTLGSHDIHTIQAAY